MNQILTSSFAMLTLTAVLSGCSTGLTALGDTAVIPTDPDVDPEDTDTPDLEDTDPPDTDVPIVENAPPVADAGLDLDAMINIVVDLDGTASYDPDGDELLFDWAFVTTPSGYTNSIINADRDTAQFFADLPGTYVIELMVDDGLETATDEVTVTVEQPNEIPVANAGSDQYVDEGDQVQLNGSNSYDPDSDPLTYAWAIIDGPVGSASTLDDPSSPLPRFTPDSEGVYSVELIVEDSNGNVSAPDVVRITSQSTDSGGSGGSGGGGGCFSCVAAQAHHRFASGSSAAIPALFLLPLLLLVRRRRD